MFLPWDERVFSRITVKYSRLFSLWKVKDQKNRITNDHIVELISVIIEYKCNKLYIWNKYIAYHLTFKINEQKYKMYRFIIVYSKLYIYIIHIIRHFKNCSFVYILSSITISVFILQLVMSLLLLGIVNMSLGRWCEQ